MSYIYLIRHARPEISDARSYCIGDGSDLPLSAAGKEQAKELALCLEGLDIKRIFCSSLRRSWETATLMSNGKWSLSELSLLNEVCVGEWEGLSFDEIRVCYPQTYQARSEDWTICPPGGENLEQAALRMEKAVKEMASEDSHHIPAVTHDGAIRSLLWKLLDLDPKKDPMPHQAYGSITVLKYENDLLSVIAIGKQPEEIRSNIKNQPNPEG